MNFKITVQKLYFTLCHYLRGDILLSSWIYPIRLKYANNNFGDDINIPILHALTGKKSVVMHSTYCRSSRNILCIGSIVENFTNAKSIIWGSGAISGEKPLKEKPLKVCAVRGPLTQKYLMRNGVECPEIYGDPALLLPLIYNPKAEKRYKIGIIPHYSELNLPHVTSFVDTHPEVRIIKLRDYKSWEDVIDQIFSCEFIISSSLHGLIVSDAYGIPNIWAQFSDKVEGGDYKYKDYFAGVGRNYQPAIDMKKNIRVDEIEKWAKSYKPIMFDSARLLKAFPYKLSKEFAL